MSQSPRSQKEQEDCVKRVRSNGAINTLFPPLCALSSSLSALCGAFGMFRFEDLQIWQRAADLAVVLDELSEELELRRRYRFAEQLRAAGLSISNNIAEGSGSNSTPGFRKFLYIARKSLFECASMLLVFERRQLIETDVTAILNDLDPLSRMIVSFSEKLQ